MPDVDGISGGDRRSAAVLFMIGGMYTLDGYSTLNSSPWTAENFGGDPDKAKSCREYVKHAIGFSMAFTGVSSYIGKTWWPLIGGVVSNAYLFWLYERALKRGSTSGSTKWGQSGGTTGPVTGPTIWRRP